MKKFKLAAVAGALALAAASAQASVVTISPQGNGSTISVGALDWAANGVLATPVTGTNAAQPAVGDVLQSYAQAALSGFLDSNGDNIGVAGLNSSFEWTFVAGFQELVTSRSVGIDPITFLPTGVDSLNLQTTTGGDNFFKIYVSPKNANSLAGTGYADGTLIMSGQILPYNASTNRGQTVFSTSGAALITDLDKSPNGNDYPGVKSVTGSGSATIDALVQYVNKDYFTDYPTGLNLGDVLAIYLDTQANDPFTQANPSALFTKGDGSTVVGAPSVGPINGVTGPNFMLQSDATSNFQVPEPTSMALAGLALAGLGVTRRRTAK